MNEEFDTDEVSRAEMILRYASWWARDIAGKMWPDRDAADLPPTVKGIVLAASRREFENPRKVIYDVKGPESASLNQRAYPPGFFTDVEYAYFRRFRPGGGLWTQGTYRDDFDMTLGYVRAMGLGKAIPYFNPGDPGWEESEHS